MTYRVRALVEYDGTGYAGFQRQSRQPTIQADLEAVLLRLTGRETSILYAGRTDAGVHAEGQVIAFDTEWRHTLTDLWRGMNALLSPAIAVQRLEVAEERFHPRFDALSRTYRYRIWNAAVRSPLRERYAWHLPGRLDVDGMRRATAELVGSHDFATFGQPTQGESTIRAVHRVEWGQEGALVWMDIEANAFLRHMVRCVVGSALRVGLGESTIEAFIESFRACERARSAPPAPPQGLCLVQVRYAGQALAVAPA
jgi:tRNA pseudouridine38-40 synthase